MSRQPNLTDKQVTQLNKIWRDQPGYPRNLEFGTIIRDLQEGGNEATHEPVATLAALQAIPADELDDKMMIMCEATGCGLYRYDSSSTATASIAPGPYYVVQPTAVTTGRFILIMPLTTTGDKRTGVKLAADFAGGPFTATVTFSTAFADTNYRVALSVQENITAWVTTKAAGTFIINLSAAPTPGTEVDWVALHD